MYRLAGFDIARNVSLLGKITFSGGGNFPSRLHIESGAIIGVGVILGLDDEIRIGKNVSISPYTTIFTGTHPIGFGSRRMDLRTASKPVVIEDGAWVGMNSLILPGTTIGHGSVISAGSVVRETIAPDSLVEGNPAVVTKQLPFGNR